VAEPAVKRASYEDVLAAPRHLVAEVIDGTLYTHSRPAIPHTLATSELGYELTGPFRRGINGPGGWLILDEPELHLGAEPDIVVPDLAGWRTERMPRPPRAPFIELTPDWLCEVLSPRTAGHDRSTKMPVYRRERVAHIWLIDPEAQTLEVFRLDGETYRLLDTHAGPCRVRAEPFDAVEIDLAPLWISPNDEHDR
jgi:Uma2 family endonuclease